MPHWKCTTCHHEWDGSQDSDWCYWCTGVGKQLEETTPFERFVLELGNSDGTSQKIELNREQYEKFSALLEKEGITYKRKPL